MIASYLDIRFEDGYTRSSGDAYITKALKLHVAQQGHHDIDPYLRAGWHIRDAMPQAISIDHFIDTHNEDRKIELCGKLAIVRSILEAESHSLLYIDNTNIYNTMNFNALESTWYSSFLKLLTENCRASELAERLKTISLIIFNYDRCVEHFLFNSFKNYYGIDDEESAELVDSIDIFHPYGVVGNLPWQGGQFVEFGAKPQPHVLLQLASDIKTFTEGTDPDSSKIVAIRNSIGEADNIVFLGYAFHDLNMQLISPNGIQPDQLSDTTYYGTAKGISDSDCIIIRNELSNLKQSGVRGININNKLDCASLFNEYWRSLSLKNT